MNVLWIFAHPEQRSLNGSLMTDALHALDESGHAYRVSDLYLMKWKAVLDADDFGRPPAGRERLLVGAAQERAYTERELSADIRAEIDKLVWADVVVFHFPLWWFGPPAILKGWLDRVLVQGFGFGVKAPDGHTRRYGDGGLAGKRALVVTSVGARPSGFGPRGIHGRMDEVLFPLLHGTAWYTGMAPLAPFVVYGADRHDATEYARTSAALVERLRTLPDAEPLAYRAEAGDAYDEELVLRPALAPGRDGLGIHLGEPGDQDAA
ncbi:NAD(P)H-dependent oxidoreductase [Streptomyces sp. VRA16 Mangrove soil]|uniref:NAD(P)H-dependent oxidoreductase n=1 Tax=Streptomyces sp. VRA16 Mangrove soil TaxID=2817434 RepID=UPI001A9E0BC6|nr:NAD(P)H-dependent oxidoreductase [Streptomyces sp. VRA16 Mangrove soil]MBO1332270.1 NAD(P)H-dependent oxidoreductase [Streptomyces sp. VRA16 Mangrove soil]